MQAMEAEDGKSEKKDTSVQGGVPWWGLQQRLGHLYVENHSNAISSIGGPFRFVHANQVHQNVATQEGNCFHSTV